jgi:uncharacterized protein involved in type VI secretion and phage assembly
MNAQETINNLMQAADTDPDFEAWKAEHPERAAQVEAMSREEVIQEILRLLEELGILPPEPQTETENTTA